MARSKIKCKGRTKANSPCSNWAIQGSYYCHLHEDQETGADVQQMDENKNTATVILVVILVLGLLISMAAGCEKEFMDWATR